MRIIAGTARSLPLKTIEGMDTRPTTDRIKETLFNMLQNDVPGCYFLDLFAGSGQIGLEAVSRGARYAVLWKITKKHAHVLRTISILRSLTGKQNYFRAMSFLLSAAWKESTGLMSFSWILRTGTNMKKKCWNV